MRQRQTETPRGKVKAVAERMRMFFVGTGMKSASRETVEKWARDIEAALKEEREA